MDFLNKTCKKSSKSKTEKKNITIEFYIFEIVQVPNILNKTILNFRTKLIKKWYFRSKRKQTKMKITIKFYIFELV